MATTEVRTQADIERVPVRRYDEMAASMGFSRISWAAILAGSAVWIALQFWFSLVGVTIGAVAIHPLQGGNPFEGMGVGTAVFMALAVLVSSYVGGRIAGRFGSAGRKGEALAHGFATWAVTCLAVLTFAGGLIGAALGGVSRLAGGALSGAGQAAGQAAAQQPGAVAEAADAARQEGAKALGQGGQPQAGQPAQPAQAQGGGGTQGAQAPQGNAQTPKAELEAKARTVADAAAKAFAKTSLGISIMMLLGFGSSLLGAASAVPPNSALSRRF